RESLRQEIWGSETFVDFDRGLNFCVAQIRLALGDSADSPRYVRTLPKRGYQFIAPVERLTAPARVEPASPAGATAGRRSLARLWAVRPGALALALVMLVTALAVRWLILGQAPASTPGTTIAVVRFDNETDSVEL